jgi:hypothetical protein
MLGCLEIASNSIVSVASLNSVSHKVLRHGQNVDKFFANEMLMVSSSIYNRVLIPLKPHEHHLFFFFFNFYLFIYLMIHLFTCTYIVWVTSPPCPPHFQTEPVLPLSLIVLKKRHKHNKEDKVFLLVELRIAIQKYS